MKIDLSILRKSIKKCTADLFMTYTFAVSLIFSALLAFAFFVADYYDFPSYILDIIPTEILLATCLVIAIIIIIFIVVKHIYNLLFIVSVNPLDSFLVILILGSMLYIFMRHLWIGNCIYTTYACVIGTVSLLALLVRFAIHCTKVYSSEAKTGNLIDLKDLYEGNLSRTLKNPIHIAERDVDYDLLERTGTINQLYLSIIHCQPDQSYVISLEGAWGTGKTTVINNTKKFLKKNNDEIVIIDDFDPWLYGTQEALLLGMFETLLHHMQMKYSPLKSNRMMRGLQETLSNSHWVGSVLHNIIDNPLEHGDEISELKRRISSFLQTKNKTFVFFIDNLDRANDENVVFLFKLIGIVFDLPRVIYVLSFERERINQILQNTHEIDPRFTEKIIQQEIKIPPIGEDKLRFLYSVCIQNLLHYYGVRPDGISEYEKVLNYIVNKTSNVRMFKRMVNSIFSLVFCADTPLKRSELFTIEVIHFYDPDLFYAIYRNSRFFISHDKSPVLSLEIGFNKKVFNSRGKEFFENLFINREAELELLKGIFPYVARYKQNTDLEWEHHFSDPEYINISQESRICSGKYFDLYFSYSTNDYIVINKDIKLMIAEINKISEPNFDFGLKNCIKIVGKHLHALNIDAHKEWVEQLQMNLDYIQRNCISCAMISIYSLIYNIDNRMEFLSLNARSRAIFILSEMVQKCTDEEFDNFIKLIKQDYKYIYAISNIYYYLNSDKLEQTAVRKARANRCLELLSTMLDTVVLNNIDLYSNEYYYPKNSWGLYHCFKNQNNPQGFTTYIQKHLSDNSIYRVLWDTTSVAMSRGYTYSIAEDNIKTFVGDLSLIDTLLEKRSPQNDDERFVFELYNAFRYGQPDEYGHKGITVPNEKHLEL